MEDKDREGVMIPFDFDYYRPDSVEEAVKTHRKITEQGRRVIYYAGGTEVISQARVNQIRFDAVIDIKWIPECNILEFQKDKLVVGAAVTLTRISDSSLFPFLGAVCRKSADHTARDKITLGGNICGKSPYKEAVLPLLLTDSELIIAGENGIKSTPITQVFNEELKLNHGEFLMQVVVDKSNIDLPYINIKKTKQEKVDYPLVTAALTKRDRWIGAAFSGLCSYPFMLSSAEVELNSELAPLDAIVDNVFGYMPAPILDDMLGSSEYREFIARNVLSEALAKLGK